MLPSKPRLPPGSSTKDRASDRVHFDTLGPPKCDREVGGFFVLLIQSAKTDIPPTQTHYEALLQDFCTPATTTCAPSLLSRPRRTRPLPARNRNPCPEVASNPRGAAFNPAISMRQTHYDDHFSTRAGFGAFACTPIVAGANYTGPTLRRAERVRGAILGGAHFPIPPSPSGRHTRPTASRRARTRRVRLPPDSSGPAVRFRRRAVPKLYSGWHPLPRRISTSQLQPVPEGRRVFTCPECSYSRACLRCFLRGRRATAASSRGALGRSMHAADANGREEGGCCRPHFGRTDPNLLLQRQPRCVLCVRPRTFSVRHSRVFVWGTGTDRCGGMEVKAAGHEGCEW
ncbi:hypothetical protein C8J57DRAFT_1718232 [Mycena rebaudengoi]|nr:hypothetical protein C8J57DRAFT_1718232 [Mycena rebaudengoi]